MRMILAVVALSIIGGGSVQPALAQGVEAAPTSYNWKREPAPPLFGYARSMGEETAQECGAALERASGTPFQDQIAAAARTSTPVADDVRMLGTAFRVMASSRPFIEQAVVDRAPIIAARRFCRMDARTAPIRRDTLSESLGIVMAGRPGVMAGCKLMPAAMTRIIADSVARINAHKAGTMSLAQLNDRLLAVAAVDEMLADTKAHCPGADVGGIAKRNDELRAALEPIRTAAFQHPDFQRSQATLIQSAEILARTTRGEMTDASLASMCGVLLASHRLLLERATEVEAGFRLQPDLPPRWRAIFALSDACRTSAVSARRAGQALAVMLPR